MPTTPDPTTTTPPPAAVAPAAGEYAQVVILKSDEINGFAYRRGQKPYVDADTFAALQSQGMI